MTNATICCAGKTAALHHTCSQLQELGYPVSSKPDWNTRHLLLDVPSFRQDLWTETQIDTLLSSLHPGVTLWGGYLSSSIQDRFHTIDLLLDEEYLVRNAAITADCALSILEDHLTQGIPVLIIGWGRIGKALAGLMNEKGCCITIASTREETRESIGKAGYRYLHQKNLSARANAFRAIINTAPAPMLDEETLSQCTECVKMDLASVKGLAGDDVIWARALPGRMAPEASGRLIAETFLRLWKEETP